MHNLEVGNWGNFYTILSSLFNLMKSFQNENGIYRCSCKLNLRCKYGDHNEFSWLDRVNFRLLIKVGGGSLICPLSTMNRGKMAALIHGASYELQYR